MSVLNKVALLCTDTSLKVVACELTFLNVLVEDVDVCVPVGADVLVVEAQSVEDLVLHRAGVQTAVGLQGDRLSSPLTSHVGPAPDKINKI